MRRLALVLGFWGCGDDVPCEPEPILIDRARLSPSAEVFQELLGCQPRTFDLTEAIGDPETQETVTIVWLLDHVGGQGAEPDAINRFNFTFDPCQNPKSVPGKVHVLEALVFDRALPIEVVADADGVKAFDDPKVTRDSVLWFFGFEENACCF